MPQDNLPYSNIVNATIAIRAFKKAKTSSSIFTCFSKISILSQ